MKRLLIIGDSLNDGFGFDGGKEDPRIWPNLLNKSFPDYEFINKAQGGRNNQWVFHQVATNILNDDYDVVLACWGRYPRYNIPVGLETYKTWTMLWEDKQPVGTNQHGTVSIEYLDDIGQKLLYLHNDHWDVLKIVEYTNILTKLQEQNNGKMFFVNGDCMWEPGFFDYDISKIHNLSNFEKKMFNADNRSDLEIIDLYNMIHRHYKRAGGIYENQWLNLYDPVINYQVDEVVDDRHPGPISQTLIAKLLEVKLKENL